MDKTSYLIINYILAGVIACMLIYSGFFFDSDTAVQCIHQKWLGKPCASCGITRAFHEILILNFDSARQLNPYAIRVFLFFFIELIFRLFINFFLLRRVNTKKLIGADGIVALALFGYCFAGFILTL